MVQGLKSESWSLMGACREIQQPINRIGRDTNGEGEGDGE